MKKFLLVLLFIFFGLVAFLALIKGPSRTSPTTSVSSEIDIGSQAWVYVDNDPEVLIAVDEKAFEEKVKAFLAKDWYGITNLVTSGRAFAVERKTRVLVIDSGFGKRKVRILEGKYTGMAGWVEPEFLHISP